MYSFLLDKFLMPLGSLFFSGNYSRYRSEWKVYDSMGAEELEKIQSKNLEQLLRYARVNVPYYRHLDLPENPTFKDFPILTKDILRKESDSLISDKFEKRKLEKNHSSGSSGSQSFTYMSFDHKFYLRAIQTHWWTWGGYKPGEFLIQTGISPNRTFPKKLKDIFFRTQYIEAFNLNEEKIENILVNSERKRIKHFAGYPSALNEIAEYAIARNKVYTFKSIIAYGDKMFGHYKKNLKKAFADPRIVETYGCAEGLHMACKVDLPYYYIMSPHVFLEIVDDEGKKLKDGNRGHILVTCLTNKAMPLIRYKLGDIGVKLPKRDYPKKKKFNYELLQEVTGRETEVIKTPNNSTLIVHTFTGIFEYYQEIKQFKVIQLSSNRLIIEYTTDDSNPISEKKQKEIREKLNFLTEGSMQINLKKVKFIAASPSGKPQIIEIRKGK